MDIKNIIFDIDNPLCLYCNGSCSTHTTGVVRLQTDTYYCDPCNESFIFFYKDDVLNTFEFTCNNYSILIDLDTDIYKICLNVSDLIELQASYNKPVKYIKVPEFTIDFSNKQKLFEKLNTYAIFS